jgi:hypothetical protein
LAATLVFIQILDDLPGLKGIEVINAVFGIQCGLAGLLAGLGAWLSLRQGVPWSFGVGFLGSLLATGVFAALLLGGLEAFPAWLSEGRGRKAIGRFAPAGAMGLALAMPAAVVYAGVFEVIGDWQVMPHFLLRTGWWLLFGTTLAAARGIYYREQRVALVAWLGLTPGLVIGGLILDHILSPRGWGAPGSLVIGLGASISYFFVAELLKEAWLEEYRLGIGRVQFVFEREEFWVGADEECDLTIDWGPAHLVRISERDGVHLLEVVEDEPVLIGGQRYQCRALVDGDAITIGRRVWVYHNRWARTRDTMPEAAC